MRSSVPLLLLALALLAAASPVVKWLQANQPLMVDAEAINFCNVLFVGNLMAGVVALVTFRPKAIAGSLGRADGRTWGLLFVNAAFAVAIPAMIFIALSHTTVTNLVLLGRFESVAFALLSAVFLGNRVARIAWGGYAVIVFGILGIVLVQAEWHLMKGEMLVIGAALLQGIAALVSRNTLDRTELGTFVFFRNLVSALVFFGLGSWHFGLEHFAHAFGPDLWVVMTVYAIVIIVVGQLAWYRALSRLPATTVSSWSMTSPALGILFAYLLLGEVPTPVQWIGGGVILTGMVLVRLGARGPRARDAGASSVPLGMERSLAGG